MVFIGISHNITNSDNPSTFRCSSKNLEDTLLFVDFSKAFNSIHRGTMEKILLPYDQHRETKAATMMLYKNTKVKVHSPDGDTKFFDIVIGMLQGDTLAPYLFIICLDYALWMKENSLTQEKVRSR